MKKVLSVIMIMLLCVSLLCSCGKKEDAAESPVGTKVFVTIASEGELAMYEEVVAIDVDGDGVISVSDAIASAHNAKFEGGAEAGYVAENTDFGITIFKLWGVENGGSYVTIDETGKITGLF